MNQHKYGVNQRVASPTNQNLKEFIKIPDQLNHPICRKTERHTLLHTHQRELSSQFYRYQSKLFGSRTVKTNLVQKKKSENDVLR